VLFIKRLLLVLVMIRGDATLNRKSARVFK
jgi:hypothetical protein